MRLLSIAISILSTSLALAITNASHHTVVPGGGAFFAEGVYADAMFTYTFVNPSVTIEYFPVGGPAALCHMMTSAAPSCTSGVLGATSEYYSYGLSDDILPPSDYEANPDLQMYPTLAIPMVPVYNLNGATGLILTPLALAQIFSGQITTWDDSRIVTLNPNFTAWGVPPNTAILVASFPLYGRTMPFRAALAAFDPVTAAIFAGAGGYAWGCNVTYQTNTEAYVASFPYTISFTSLALATDNQVPVVTLLKKTGLITATAESALYAVLELGLTFGNNGDDPSHLTANIVNAQGANAWPIVAYTYMVMRKSTLLGNSTCAEVQAAAEFWQWFYTDTIAATITSQHGLVPLPSLVQSFVLNRLIGDILCEGTPVLAVSTQLSLVGLGVSWMSNFFGQVAPVYSLTQPQVAMGYNSTNVFRNAAQVQSALATAPFVVSSLSLAKGAPASQGVPLVLAGVGHVIITGFTTLTLDVCTLANILDGTIRTWLHPDIVKLNPGGLSTATGNLTDPKQPIVLLAGPTGLSVGMIALFTRCVPSFTGAALIMAQAYTDDILLRAAVSVLPYTITLTPLAGTFDSGLTMTAVVNAQGAAIQPSWGTVQACATPETFNPPTGTWDLTASLDPNCYLLSSTVYATVRPSACNVAKDGARTAAVDFLTWLIGSSALATALHEQNMAWLGGLPTVAAANAAGIVAITCQPVAGSSWVIIVIVACVVGVLLLGILAGFSRYMWKATADLRALKKQFSDDNVAQECAAAIARFDLDAVAWLKEAKAPTAIQTSFLRIIHLLTEVKPYIPDQLLQALRRTGESDSGDTEEPLEEELRGKHKTPKDSSTASSLVVSDGESGDNTVAIVTQSSSRASGSTAATRRTPAALPVGEWARKRCVYLYLQYDLSGHDTSGSSIMGGLLTDFVTIGKAHGATIDHLALGTLALHWGVVASSSEAARKAATAAMEMALVRRTLPSSLQGQLALQACIGYGVCDVATLTAGGHRFFVVGGREVRLAREAVMKNSAKQVQAEVMLTETAQAEVKYCMECMPRVLFNGVLMWEPLKVRDHGAGHDEWMYELQTLEETGDTFNSHNLVAVFEAARRGESPVKVQAEVIVLRSRFAAQMSTQDHLALDMLLQPSAAGQA